MAGVSYKGIYVLTINGKPYVGKDSNIFRSSRLTQHIAYFRDGNHNNKEMQNDYNEYGESALLYSIVCFNKDYTEQELRSLEQYYVEKYDSFNNGYNNTLGGVGTLGYKQSHEQIEKRSIALTGENNPSSKLTNKEFYEMVDLFKKGFTNDEIAELYKLHSRYISLIRHKKRFKQLWKNIDYTPKESTKGKEKRMIDYNTYVEIMNWFENGAKNLEVENKYKLSSGTGSRLRNGKLYRDFYDQFKEIKII